MNVRQTNLVLQITAVVLVGASVFSTAAGLLSPMEIPQAAEAIPMLSNARSRVLMLPPVDSFAPLFARSLQTQVGTYAGVASAQIDPSSAEPTIPISQLVLVGTVGSSLALIKGPDGSIAMIEAGDDVEGSAVLAVRPSQVDLRVNGKVTTLRIAPAPDDSAFLQTK